MSKKELERRDVFHAKSVAGIETREDGKEIIAGYAAVFYDGSEGTEYDLWGDGSRMERISPGAFKRAIKEGHDVRALFNHSPDFLLGRSSSGTLTLIEDKRGLRYEIDPPDTQVGRDTLTNIKRGDLTGSSFAFRVTSQLIREQKTDDDEFILIREIEDVDLIDVGPVTFPAYSGTTTEVSTRCFDEYLQTRRKKLLDIRKRKANTYAY